MSQKMSKAQFVKYWLPVLSYAACIFFVSSLSSTGVNVHTFFYGFGDKIVHAMEYAVLGILLFRAFRYASMEKMAIYASVLAVAVAVVYGVSDEVHQSFVPLRHPDGWDVAADAVGAFLGVRVWSAFFAQTVPVYSA